MIQNDEELAVEQRALGHVERALESLRADVEAKNPRNFAVFSEAYVDQINILKAQIDEYLARKKAKAPETTGAQTPVGQDPSSVSS